MPTKSSKKLTIIARKAKREAVAEEMQRFNNNRSAVAAYFGITVQAIGQIIARK